MDPYAQGGMIFTIIMTVIIGGFIITYPVMRRLGLLLEESIRERRASRLDQSQVGHIASEIADLQASIDRVEGHMGLLTERQDFVESLLTHRESQKLPKTEDWQG